MSFAHLATIGTLSYNGYTFDGSSSVSVRVSFVMDEAERTVLYHEHSISVRFFVQNSTGTDSDLEAIRAALSHQGAELVFINKGFGDDLIVNAAGGGGLRDVKWGPKPKILEWNPAGAGNACEIVWEVTACVPKCAATSSGRFTGVMAMNYSIDIAINNKGLSFRTISGYLEIAQTRIGYNVPDSADAYRHFIQPPQPDGFGRSSNWRFSADKSRVEFSISDEQIPSRNPYPALVTNISGSFRSSWSRGAQLKNTARCSISLDIEPALTAPRLLGWTIFGNLLRSKLNAVKSVGKRAFIEEVTAEEDLFGLGSRFGCSYRVLMTPGAAMNTAATTSPNDLLTGQPNIQGVFDFPKIGMWAPLGGSWSQWRTSLSHVFSNRGLAGLAVPAANDVIIDLCNTGVTIPWNGTIPPATVPVVVTTGTFKNEKPPPEQSYLGYQCGFLLSNKRPAVRQSPMQPSETDGSPGNMMDQGGFQPPQRNSTGSSGSSSSPDVIQSSGPGQYSLTFFGCAARAGYNIPRPKVLSVGGQTPVEFDGQYLCQHTGDTFGVQVYKAAWRVDYLLPTAPSNLSPPARLEA